MTDLETTEPRYSRHVANCSEAEKTTHRDLLLRHIDFLSDVLAGEQYNRQWTEPCGCPHSTPAKVAHVRERGKAAYPCVFQRIETLGAVGSDDTECICGDPLAGSDDPLDAVAAVVISGEESVHRRYFNHYERSVISSLRSKFGSWEEIAAIDVHTLQSEARVVSGHPSVTIADLERLHSALATIEEHRYFGQKTLVDVPSVSYTYLHDALAEIPGVSESDAWWLLLTAFDKPVWPADKMVDGLLVELGLLDPDAPGETQRHEHLEEELTARQILPLHRALAGHAYYCGTDHATADCEIRRFTLTHRIQEQTETDDQPTIKVADLFCGAGGLSHGFSRAEENFEVALAVDNNQHATDTYRLNHPEVPHERVHCEDIGEVAADTAYLEEFAHEIDVVVGGPPCQALSLAGYRARRASDDSYSVLEDPRTGLYRHYVSILETLEPTFIVMENVDGIRNELGDSNVRVIDNVEEALSEAGYMASHRLLDCSEFGIPQKRERVVLFGVKQSAVSDPESRVANFFEDLSQLTDDSVTIKQALANLPRLRRGEGGDVVAGRQPGQASSYLRENGLNGDVRLTFNHLAREHPMEKDRTLFDEAMSPGDTGWDIKYNSDYGHLIEYNVGTEANPAFKDKYRMLHWNRPSPTIVAHLAKDANSFILPDYYEHARVDTAKQDSRRNRGITPREAARLQSFPDSYVFLGPFTSQFRQIGNAVPPLLGQQIASVLGSYLNDSQALSSSSVSLQVASTDD